MRFHQPVVCEFPTRCCHKLGVLPKCPCAHYLLLLFSFFFMCHFSRHRRLPLSLLWGHPLLHYIPRPNNHFNGCSRLHGGLLAWLHHIRSHTHTLLRGVRTFLPSRSLVPSFFHGLKVCVCVWALNILFRMKRNYARNYRKEHFEDSTMTFWHLAKCSAAPRNSVF